MTIYRLLRLYREKRNHYFNGKYKMIWLAGIIGLLGGFSLGIYILKTILRNKSKEELLNDKDLRLKYGGLVWAMAIICCISTVYFYKNYFMNAGE